MISFVHHLKSCSQWSHCWVTTLVWLSEVSTALCVWGSVHHSISTLVLLIGMTINSCVYLLSLTVCNSSELGSNPTSTDGPGSVTAPNGVVTYNGVTFGSMATLICNSGSVPAAGTSNRTCKNNGFWSGEIQSCVSVMTSDCKLIVAFFCSCLTLFNSCIFALFCFYFSM